MARGLERLGLKAEELQALPKGAAEKAVLAWWLRQRTTVTLRWMSQRLDMGHDTRVTQAVSWVARRPARKMAALGDRLRRLDEKKAR